MSLLLSLLRPYVVQQEFPAIMSLSLLQNTSCFLPPWLVWGQEVGFCLDSEHSLDYNKPCQ